MNSQLATEVRNLDRQVRNNQGNLANSTALWLRQRLDAGENPRKLKPLFDQLKSLDPDRKEFFARLLPELVDSGEDGREKKTVQKTIKTKTKP